jgi:hypothetical protein
MTELFSDRYFTHEAALNLEVTGRVGLQELDDRRRTRFTMASAIHFANCALRQQRA